MNEDLGDPVLLRQVKVLLPSRSGLLAGQFLGSNLTLGIAVGFFVL